MKTWDEKTDQEHRPWSKESFNPRNFLVFWVVVGTLVLAFMTWVGIDLINARSELTKRFEICMASDNALEECTRVFDVDSSYITIRPKD